MPNYISILRGINVSGKKLIKMDTLVQLYESLGFENITTYVQSGNVVFTSTMKNLKKIESKIYDKIKETFDFDVPNIVLEMEYLSKIVDANPFKKDESKQTEFMYFTFLSSKPEQIDSEKLDQLKGENDEYEIVSDIVYLYCPNGYSSTKLTNTTLEKVLNTVATTRNYNTTTALLKMAQLK